MDVVPGEPTLATAAATLSSKLTAEPIPLTESERALMREWLGEIG